jgi:hypothetical protein
VYLGRHGLIGVSGQTKQLHGGRACGPHSLYKCVCSIPPGAWAV